MESFEDASEFLEKFLLNFGIGKNGGDQYFPPSGELLFQAYQSFHKIEEAINAKEPEIIKRLGDRREKFESDQTPPMAKLPGYHYQLGLQCFGTTSHSCGVLVMLNLINEAIPADDSLRDIDESATWGMLTNPEKERIALCEQSFSTWGGAISLAQGVRFERIAIRKTPPSASTVDQQRLKFYVEQKAKNRKLKYKNAADLWNKKETDHCDETAFKQSCWRANQNVTK